MKKLLIIMILVSSVFCSTYKVVMKNQVNGYSYIKDKYVAVTETENTAILKKVDENEYILLTGSEDMKFKVIKHIRGPKPGVVLYLSGEDGEIFITLNFPGSETGYISFSIISPLFIETMFGFIERIK